MDTITEAPLTIYPGPLGWMISSRAFPEYLSIFKDILNKNYSKIQLIQVTCRDSDGLLQNEHRELGLRISSWLSC